MRIDPLRMSVVFAGEDPAAVAQTYGWASSAMWTLMPQLERLLKIPDPHIHLGTDFGAARTQIEGEAGITFRIGDLLIIGLGFGIPLLKWLRKRKKGNRTICESGSAAGTGADRIIKKGSYTMENNEKKNHSLIDLMDASMSKIREMVDSNTIIGEPIQTPDGVTPDPRVPAELRLWLRWRGLRQADPRYVRRRQHCWCEGGAGGVSGGEGRCDPCAAGGRACRDHGGPHGGDGPGGHGPGGTLHRQEKRGKRELLTE